MYFGYNTNGFAHHRLEDAIEILAELGYEGVAITLDYQALNPYELERVQLRRVRELILKHRLRVVVETGSRFLLDSRRKHQPTLISPTSAERDRRFDFLLRSISLANHLGAEAVSFWSGTPVDDAGPSVWLDRLVEGCKALTEEAGTYGVRLAFEPEPGMFIDTMDKFAELHRRVDHPAFGLTIDVGHLHCNGEVPVSQVLVDWRKLLWNVHIEDMVRGVHDHRMFAEGEMDFADVFTGLNQAEYTGGVFVELSRHSHDAVNTARRSLEYLKRYIS